MSSAAPRRKPDGGKAEHPLAALSVFLPEGAWDVVVPYFSAHPIHLTLTRHRVSLHGDYRPPTKQHPAHRISVNKTLNKYSFFVTLLHELAHLLTTVHYGRRAAPHGPEWKGEFQKILVPVLGKGFFPRDVEAALQSYLRNPAASTCTDPALYKALAKHDARAQELIHAEDVPVGGQFDLNGRLFEKIAELRTRSRCREVASGKVYFVQGIALVKRMNVTGEDC